MTAHQEQVYKWQFPFLVGDGDRFANLRELAGVHADVAQYNKDHLYSYDSAVDPKVARIRPASGYDRAVENAFTDEERQTKQ